MKHLFFGFLLFIGLAANAQVGTYGLGLVAPNIYGKANASSPAIGEIIFDTSDLTFYGNASTTATPNWVAFAGAGTKVAPTVSIASTTNHTGGFSANGSGTYTTPAGVLYIRVRMVGAGGGGGGSSTSAANNGGTGGGGSSGNNTTFGSFLTAGGGSGGSGSSGGNGGNGGTTSVTTTSGVNVLVAVDGGRGAPAGEGQGILTTYQFIGGNGAASVLGGGGAGGQIATAGDGGRDNTGAGGGGGGSPSGGIAGKGGGAGAYIEAIITSPSSSYSYAVGAKGNFGTGGTSGVQGGYGGSGYIEVTEYYQ